MTVRDITFYFLKKQKNTYELVQSQVHKVEVTLLSSSALNRPWPLLILNTPCFVIQPEKHPGKLDLFLLCSLPYTHQMAIVTVHKGLRSPDRGQWHLMRFSSPSSLWRLVLPPLVTITGPSNRWGYTVVITADGWGPCSSLEMSASLFQIKVHWIRLLVPRRLWILTAEL